MGPEGPWDQSGEHRGAACGVEGARELLAVSTDLREGEARTLRLPTPEEQQGNSQLLRGKTEQDTRLSPKEGDNNRDQRGPWKILSMMAP